MMHLILADSELEIIPEKIRNHPAIKRSKSLILDASLHHTAMKRLQQWQRRGRPDIVHIFLLIANESILNKKGMLRVYIHTRNDEIIYVKPGTRIIKNYNRFKGLMEQLFKNGKVPPEGEALMEMKEGSLKDLLNELKGKKILFSMKGKRKRIEEAMEKDVICIIGGFPSGDFLSPVHEMVDEIVSIYDEMLPAWIVEMEAIVAYENKFIAGKL
ncbi:MAG: 16S rRNA methyltransferase [Thermoplasmata archaeon]|nr:MAG: 16S rRNA methyltransferase [Thermoplasmata archaeon]